MTRQITPSHGGIKPIRTNGLALSNVGGACNSMGKALTAGGVNTWTGPQPQIAASPKVSMVGNQKPMAGSQTSSKGGHK